MQPIVLVIDSNSAVQAITALALNQTDCRVEPLTDGTIARQKVKELNPAVILCARDISGLDPFELCRTCKQENEQLAFILLAPSGGAKVTAENAAASGCDEVIYKPFKSNRLREVVQNLLLRQKPASHQQKISFLDIAHPLRSRIIKRYLERCGYQVMELKSPRLDDVKDSARFTISDQEISTLLKTFTKERLGKCITLQATGSRQSLPSNLEALHVPITEIELKALFGEVLRRQSKESRAGEEKTTPSAPSGVFHPNAARNAAKLCAALFEHLLTSQDFESASLEEKANFIRNEVLRLGNTL